MRRESTLRTVEMGCARAGAAVVPAVAARWLIAGAVVWLPALGGAGEKSIGGRPGDGGGGDLDPCLGCEEQLVDCDQTVTGELTADDCVLPSDDSSVDVWVLELSEPQQVSINYRSVEFDCYLFFVNDQCEVVASNDDCDGLNSCLVVQAPAGTHYIIANSYSAGETGAYALEVRCGEAVDICQDCDAGSVGCGETVTGELTADDCQPLGARYYDMWTFELTQSQEVTIEYSATMFDAYVGLFDDQCMVIAENDDCPGAGLNSCLTVLLEPGTYRVGATSLVGGVTGAYTLAISCGADPTPGDQRPGDCNGDGHLTLTDGICLLNALFAGEIVEFACGDGTLQDASNRAVQDFDGDASLNVTDAINLLLYLFAAGAPHALGVDCVPLPGCPDVCQ